MKIFFLFLVFALVISESFGAQFDSKKYQEVEISAVKATPEDLKNKKVTFETRYWRYETTFPPYVERSGYKAGKHYYLLVEPANFPVLVDKTDAMNAIIPTLKKGSKVRLYGKIKKFSSAPVETTYPHYFLELEHIEIIEEGKDDSGDGDTGEQHLPGPVKRRIIKKILND
jgi:hypothetical protein